MVFPRILVALHIPRSLIYLSLILTTGQRQTNTRPSQRKGGDRVALEALKQYAIQHEAGIENQIDSITADKPPAAPTSPATAKGNIKPQVDQQAVTEALQRRMAGAYKEYQGAIRKSGELRTQIIKGIQAGESPSSLLLTAIECIGLMTGDSTFFTTNRENIAAVHGVGLLEDAPLNLQIMEVRERLAMLTRPELQAEPENTRRRIDQAVKEHRRRERELIAYLGKAKPEAGEP